MQSRSLLTPLPQNCQVKRARVDDGNESSPKAQLIFLIEEAIGNTEAEIANILGELKEFQDDMDSDASEKKNEDEGEEKDEEDEEEDMATLPDDGTMMEFIEIHDDDDEDVSTITNVEDSNMSLKSTQLVAEAE